MSTDELSLFLGITSIVIAIGLTVFTILFDNHRRRKEERFFAEEIKTNLNAITQYFLTISSISGVNANRDETEEQTILSLNDYYVRHYQEMVDLLHVTKLYLTQWRTLSEEKKTLTRDVLKKFAWLSYEYYPLHMPDSIKKTRWQSEWRHLSENQTFIAKNISSIVSEIL